MTRIGLIGTGRAGRNHVAAIAKLNDVKLTQVSDVSAESAQRVASQSGAQAVAPEEIWNNPAIDVVDICVPTFLHREYVEKAAAAGKHIICEKPIALSVEDGKAMIAACRKAGVRLFIAHPTRFSPQNRRIKTLVDAGELGQPLAVRTWRGGRFFRGADAWLDDAGKSGSIIVEAMLHDFDALHWYFGDVDHVYCEWQMAKQPYYLEAAFATVRFQNGVLAMIEGNRIHNERFYSFIEIRFTGGLLSFDLRNNMPLNTTNVTFNGTSVGFSNSYASTIEFDQFEAEIGHFLSCLKSGQPAIVTPEDAVDSLAIALAALKSSQTGQVVKV